MADRQYNTGRGTIGPDPDEIGWTLRRLFGGQRPEEKLQGKIAHLSEDSMSPSLREDTTERASKLWRDMVPSRKALRTVENAGRDPEALTLKQKENEAHRIHAAAVAKEHATGGNTAAQGDSAPMGGSGGTPTPIPEPPTQSGAYPGETMKGLLARKEDIGYHSRVNAVRGPDGNVIFTNQPQDYGGDASRIPYEEAIEEVGGSISQPMTTPGGSQAYVHASSPPTVPLESMEPQAPMSERQIIEQGGQMAAAESDPTDVRSIMERRAWTESRLQDERGVAQEEADIAKTSLEGDPAHAMRLAELENQGRWGGEYLEQEATAEQRSAAQAVLSALMPAYYAAIEAGDKEQATAVDNQIRQQLRALGMSVPEPRSPGFQFPDLNDIEDTVDTKLEEKKQKK